MSLSPNLYKLFIYHSIYQITSVHVNYVAYVLAYWSVCQSAAINNEQ